MKNKLLLSALSLGALLIAPETHAQTPITWDGDTSTTFSDGANWVGGLAPTSDTSTNTGVFGPTITLNQPSLTTNRSIAGLVFQSPTGGWTLGGGGIQLEVGAAGIDDTANTSGVTTINSNVLYSASTVFSSGTGGNLVINGLTTMGAQRTLTVNSGTVTLSNFDGLVASRAIQKQGAGTLVLSGASVGTNSATLGLQTLGGTTVIGNVNALGASGAITLNSATLRSTVDLTGSSALGGVVTLSGAARIAGDQSISFSNSFTTENNNPLTNDLTETRVLTLAGNVNLATASAGRTLTLLGSGNTLISGAINENTITSGNGVISQNGAGSTTLTGANSFTGEVRVRNGALVFDFANNTNLLSVANNVNLTSGTLEFKGRTGSGNSSSETIGTIATATNTSSGVATIRLNRNGGDGVAITAGTLTYGSNSLLIDLGNNANSFTTATDLGTTLNTRVLVKNGSGRVDFATNTGAGTAVAALNATTDLVANAAASTDYRLTGSLTTTGNTSLIRSLRIDPSSSGQSWTLTQGISTGNTRIGALLFTGAQDFTITQSSGQTGSLGNGNASGANLSFLLHHYGTAKLTLDTKIAGGNNSGVGTGNMEMYGTGLVEWTRAASSSGTMTIGGVTLRQQTGTFGMLGTNTATGLGSGNIILASGGILETSGAGSVTRDVGTGAGQIQWRGDGGFSAFGSNSTVSLNSGATLDWSTTIGGIVNSALILGSSKSNARVDFQNGLNLGSEQRTVHVNNGVSSNDVDGRLSGVISGTGAFRKSGAGTLELTNTNTYTGQTLVSAGTLLINGSTAEGSEVSVSSGAVIGGSGTIGGDLSLAEGALLAFDTASSLTLDGTLSLFNSFGVASLRDLNGGVLNWASIGDGEYTLLNTTFSFNDTNISNFGMANAYSIGVDRVAYFQNGSLELVVATVPEPSSWALLALALTGLVVFRRRRSS